MTTDPNEEKGNRSGLGSENKMNLVVPVEREVPRSQVVGDFQRS